MNSRSPALVSSSISSAPETVGAQEVLFPSSDRFAIFPRDAEHIADDGDRKWVGERLDQVHPPVGRRLATLGGVAFGLVKEVVRDLLNVPPQRLHAPSGEAWLD